MNGGNCLVSRVVRWIEGQARWFSWFGQVGVVGNVMLGCEC